MKEGVDIHQQPVPTVLILKKLCPTAYEMLHSEVPSATDLTGHGQCQQQNCQNIAAEHHQMGEEDAVPFETQASEQLMHHLLIKRY